MFFMQETILLRVKGKKAQRNIALLTSFFVRAGKQTRDASIAVELRVREAQSRSAWQGYEDVDKALES
jgi:hypothetical protein